MKLTTTEKFVISTNIFLLLVLLTMLGLQFAINKSGVDIHQLLNPTPSATLTPNNPSDAQLDFTIEVPQPTAEEEVGGGKPRSAWIGWVVIIISGLIAAGGITFKLLKT